MSETKYKLDMLKKPTWKFVNPSDFAKSNLLYIQESGKFCSGKDYFTKRSGLNSYLIKTTISGKGVLEYCGEKYFILPKTVMFIDCKEYQNYYTDVNAGKWEMLWVHLNGKNIKPYYEKFLEKNNGSNVAVLSDDNNVCEIMDHIIAVSANYTKDHDSEIIADNLLHSLLGECIIKSGTDISSVPDFIKQSAYYLRHHYSEEIDLDFLARESNISKYHLQRTFKQVFGISPAKYLTNIRINHAKRLLRGTTLSVSEISEKIGMEPNYFIQLFKSLENETPGQYRNKWSGKPK
ncbi:MAG: helix-turn-helix transcriptional regulator [Clostridia bacterium]|nr:helix-turn-helix transcriptional regulator [Clostridia bacterium]